MGFIIKFTDGGLCGKSAVGDAMCGSQAYQDANMEWWEQYFDISPNEPLPPKVHDIYWPTHVGKPKVEPWLSLPRLIDEVDQAIDNEDSVNERLIRKEILIRLSLLHVDLGVIDKLTNGDMYEEMVELSKNLRKVILVGDFGHETEAFADESKYYQPTQKEIQEPVYENGLIVGYTPRMVEEPPKLKPVVDIEEIKAAERKTGLRFYYIFTEYGKKYGLYINPKRPDLWKETRKLLSSPPFIGMNTVVYRFGEDGQRFYSKVLGNRRGTIFSK